MKLAVFVSLLVIIPFQAAARSCVGDDVNVWVATGHDLTGDGFQDPDPYVVVKIGDDTKKSKVIKSNANPEWWQKIKFTDVSNNVLRIEIWEADGGFRGDDDHLGTCTVPMVAEGLGYRKIQCKTKDDGYVKIMYRCH